MWTRGFNLTGRERFAAGRFLARVDANRTLAPGTLESGSRPEQVWTRPKKLELKYDYDCERDDTKSLLGVLMFGWDVVIVPQDNGFISLLALFR